MTHSRITLRRGMMVGDLAGERVEVWFAVTICGKICFGLGDPEDKSELVMPEDLKNHIENCNRCKPPKTPWEWHKDNCSECRAKY